MASKNQSEELERRLSDLLARSRKGDAEAFSQAATLATNALKSVQQVRSKEADQLRQKLEHFLGVLRDSGTAEVRKDEAGTRELQRDEINRRVLAGDLKALDQSALTTFGQGNLEGNGKKLEGRLGIVFQCALVFIEGEGTSRRLHILAKPGGVKSVGMKGFLKKRMIISTAEGGDFAFEANRKKSTADESKRLESLSTLWKGLGL